MAVLWRQELAPLQEVTVNEHTSHLPRDFILTVKLLNAYLLFVLKKLVLFNLWQGLSVIATKGCIGYGHYGFYTYKILQVVLLKLNLS